MKQILLSFAVVALVGGCHAGNKNMAEKAKAAILIEEAIRKAAKKPKGDLTKADYEKLKELSLGDHYLTELPKGLEKLTQLEELILYGNQLTDVKDLENLTQLKELYLGGNKLTDVAGLENLTQLTILYLDGNKLTDVKSLEKLMKLETLYLEDNPDLTKAQIAELKKALPKCKIYSNPTK